MAKTGENQKKKAKIIKPSLFWFLKKAQAMVELAVMGSVFLSLLGILISYGVRYNAQQNLTMRAFRDSVAEASTETVGGGYLSHSGHYIQDVPVADPGSPYGVPQWQSVSDGVGSTRTYYMLTREASRDEAMARQQINIANRKGEITETNPKWEDRGNEEEDYRKGFSIVGWQAGINIIRDPDDMVMVTDYRTETRERDDGEGETETYNVIVSFQREVASHVVIKQISDPYGTLNGYSYGEPVYWTWIEVRIGTLTETEDEEGFMTEEKIEDAHAIYNRGLNLEKRELISAGDLFGRVKNSEILAQGDTLHSKCLTGIGVEEAIDIIEIEAPSEGILFAQWRERRRPNLNEASLNVRSSAWGEINLADVSDTARGMAKQGLQPREEKRTIIGEQKATTTGGNTQIDRDYQKRIKRYIKLNSGQEIEVETIIDGN